MTHKRIKVVVFPRILSLGVLSLAVLALDGVHAIATAQSSMQAPPSSAAKIGGGANEGDANGAVRAMGSVDGGSKKGEPIVTVPQLGGEGGDRTGGLPAGTAH